YNLSGIGYGFSVGLLAIPLPERLWLSLSYVSPLFTQSGDEVSLEGRPDLALYEPGAGQACGEQLDGIRISRRDNPPACGAGRLVYSYPHILYLGARVRLTRARAVAAGSSGRPGQSQNQNQSARATTAAAAATASSPSSSSNPGANP